MSSNTRHLLSELAKNEINDKYKKLIKAFKTLSNNKANQLDISRLSKLAASFYVLSENSPDLVELSDNAKKYFSSDQQEKMKGILNFLKQSGDKTYNKIFIEDVRLAGLFSKVDTEPTPEVEQDVWSDWDYDEQDATMIALHEIQELMHNQEEIIIDDQLVQTIAELYTMDEKEYDIKPEVKSAMEDMLDEDEQEKLLAIIDKIEETPSMKNLFIDAVEKAQGKEQDQSYESPKPGRR